MATDHKKERSSGPWVIVISVETVGTVSEVPVSEGGLVQYWLC